MILRWIHLIALLLIASFLFSVTSCSPAGKLRRLIKKHPELIQRDTIFIRDTIITDSIHTDTVFSIDFDTIFLEKKNLKVRIIRISKSNNHSDTDSIMVSATVTPDTIIREIPVVVNSVSVAPKRSFWFIGTLGWILIALLLAALLYVLIKRLRYGN